MALLTAGIMVSFATSGIFRLITTSLASKGALKGLQNIYPLMQCKLAAPLPWRVKSHLSPFRKTVSAKIAATPTFLSRGKGQLVRKLYKNTRDSYI